MLSVAEPSLPPHRISNKKHLKYMHITRREAQTKEEMMVSNDIIRLKMKRLRDTLNGTADEVFSLENRRQQLTMSMTERKAEIQVGLREPYTPQA